MIFTSLSPNTQKDDILFSFKLLFSPFWKSNKLDRERFIKKFNNSIGLKNSYAIDSARNGLYIFLQTLNLKESDEVLLQAYTCVALVNPILWAGATPKFVDCSKDDFNINISDLEKKITKKSKVLIVQHTFGKSADLNKLQKIAQKHNLILIEDCAHSLGTKYGDKFTGSFGDCSIFSFGRDKVISTTTGGILTVNNDKYLPTVRSMYNKLPESSGYWNFQQIIHPIILSIAKPTYNFFKLGRVIIALSIKLNLISKPILISERNGKKPSNEITKLSGSLCLIGLHQLNKLKKYNNHRIKLAKIYSRSLNKTIPKPKIDENHIYTRYTILLDNPDSIYNKFIKKNIQLGRWFNNIIIPKGINLENIGYKKNSCPNAEFLANKSINLPNGIQIKESDAVKIAKYIHEISK